MNGEDLTESPLSKRLPLLLTIGALVFQMAAVMILCAVPPVSRDALTHHLALPKLYLEKGLGTELPYISFSYFPMNIDLLYMLILRGGTDAAAKYLHCTFGLLTAVLIFLLLKKWNGKLFGLLGACFFLSLPVIAKLSISVYVDLGLVFFSMAALYAIMEWLRTGLRMRFLYMAAIFCGLALGTKYNALLVFCIMALSIPLVGINYRRLQYRQGNGSPGRGFRRNIEFLLPTLVFCLIAGSLYAPWAIRNIRWTGNPVYPLYDGVFKKIHSFGESIPETENDHIREFYRTDINRDHFLVRRVVFKESPLQIALIPLRIFFQGRDDDPRYFDGRLHPLLLLLPFLIFLNMKQDEAAVRLGKLYLLGFAWLYIIMAFLLTDLRIRYILPAIPPLVILSISGLHSLLMLLKSRFGRPHVLTAGTIVFLVAIMLPNLLYTRGLFQRYNPLAYLSGKISRDRYIEHFWRGYPVLQFVNEHLVSDDKIFSVFGGNRRYYCDRDMYFNNEWFKSLIVNGDSDRDIIQALRRQGFTHLIVDRALFEQWIYSGLTIDQRQRIDNLFRKRLHFIYAKNGHALYRL